MFRIHMQSIYNFTACNLHKPKQYILICSENLSQAGEIYRPLEPFKVLCLAFLPLKGLYLIQL